MSRPLILRVGPPASSLSRQVGSGRAAQTVAVLVEVWGAGDERAAFEAQLASGILQRFEGAQGSTTARLRDALSAAHGWIKQQAAARSTPAGFGAGASVLCAGERETVLAQVGPSLALRLDGDEARRLPAESPWLKRGVAALADDPRWPPLGTGREVAIHWSEWPSGASPAVMLCASQGAEALGRDVATKLLAAPADAARLLAEALPSDVAALYMARSAEVGAGTRPSFAAPADKGTADDARSAGVPRLEPAMIGAALAAATARMRRLSRQAGLWLRPVAVRAIRAAARVLSGLLPARAAQGSEGYRAERARLAAGAVIGLPLAVIALTLLWGERGAPPGAVAEDGVTTSAVDGGAAVADDPAAGIVRLTGLTPLINLPGDAQDERQIVVASGAPYVLDTALDRVDRIDGSVAVPVLARGRVVGDTPVAELKDLFWLPAADAPSGGSVLAFDEADRLWAVDGAAPRIVSRAAEPMWIAASRAAGYAGSLYVLDRSAGQIYRYRPGGAGGLSFSSAGEPWLAGQADVADVVDMAIDGAIYLLRRDGGLLKYAGGTPVDFEVSGVPDGLASTRAIYASPTAGRLLVAEHGHGRVVVLGPDGVFQSQLLKVPQAIASDPVVAEGRFAALQSLWWDEQGGMLYLVDGNTLLRAPYP